MKIRTLFSSAFTAFLIAAGAYNSHAQTVAPGNDVPRSISYQGMLTSSTGTPLPDGNYRITLALYADPAGSIKVWQDTYDTHVIGGIFNLYLGAGGTQLPDLAKLNTALWVGTQIDDAPQMYPLTPLSASPYALNVPDRAITTGKLADKAVTADKVDMPYIAGVQINDKQIAGTGTVLKLKGSEAITLDYDEATNSVTIGAGSGMEAGNIGDAEKAHNVLDVTYMTSNNWRGRDIGANPPTFDVPNSTSSTYNTLAGGRTNTIENNTHYSSIVGGYDNEIVEYSDYSHIGGGYDNVVSGDYATITGGEHNEASGLDATIGGGYGNLASSVAATVAGGDINQANGAAATVGGGYTNTADQDFATIAGGDSNTVSGSYGAIGGGHKNTVTRSYSAVTGGEINTVYEEHSTISGGENNIIQTNNITADHSFIGGGESNSITGFHAVIGGGKNNNAHIYATVGGGISNDASYIWSTIGGGNNNTASNSATVVAGGQQNAASGPFAAVTGGAGNTAYGWGATVGGGEYGNAIGYNTTIGGGYANIAVGDYSTIPGGDSLQTPSYAQTAIGFYNAPRGFVASQPATTTARTAINAPLFMVGNGVPNLVGTGVTRSNAFEVSYNGHSVVYDVNGTTNVAAFNRRVPFSGATYVDNVLYAWGDVDAAGNVNADFGVASVIHAGAGTYIVRIDLQSPAGAAILLNNASITATIIEKEGDPESACRLISTTRIAGNQFTIRTRDLTCKLVDTPFMFKVSGRP